MQQDSDNSTSSLVQCKITSRPFLFKGREVPGDSAFGAPIGTGGGVSAVEAIPTHSVFSLCDAEDCMDACSKDAGKTVIRRPNSNSDTDTIIGNVERVPGESRLAAAAFTEEPGGGLQQPKKDALAYSPNDFTSYSSRRL